MHLLKRTGMGSEVGRVGMVKGYRKRRDGGVKSTQSWWPRRLFVLQLRGVS